MKISYDVRGTSQVIKRLKELTKSLPEAVTIGMYAIATRVADDAVARVPVDTGELRDSAYVSKPDVRGALSVIEVGFGAKHAPEIHEATHRVFRNGEAKFLEKAILAQAKGSLYKIVQIAEKAAARGQKWTRGKYPERPKV